MNDPEHPDPPPTLDYSTGDHATGRPLPSTGNRFAVGCLFWFVAVGLTCAAGGAAGAGAFRVVGLLSLAGLATVAIAYAVRERRAGFLLGVLAGGLVSIGLPLLLLALICGMK